MSKKNQKRYFLINCTCIVIKCQFSACRLQKSSYETARLVSILKSHGMEASRRC